MVKAGGRDIRPPVFSTTCAHCSVGIWGDAIVGFGKQLVLELGIAFVYEYMQAGNEEAADARDK